MKVKFTVIRINELFTLKQDLYVKLDNASAKSIKFGTVVNIPSTAMCAI